MVNDAMRGFDVHAEDRYFQNQVAIWLFHRRPDAKVEVARHVDFVIDVEDPRTVQSGADASLVIDKQAAERLLTALWKLGLRPIGEDLEPQAGELDAMRAHLRDLQRLLFKLDVEPRWPRS